MMNEVPSFSLAQTAHLLSIPGMGSKKLVRFLRQEGILLAGDIPSQRYVERGYFCVIQQQYPKADGAVTLRAVTRVREKGVEFIRRQLTGLQRLLLESGS